MKMWKRLNLSLYSPLLICTVKREVLKEKNRTKIPPRWSKLSKKPSVPLSLLSEAPGSYNHSVGETAGGAIAANPMKSTFSSTAFNK